MASDHHERVSVRAYHLWQRSGGGSGREVDHWLAAEREIADTAKPRRPAARAKPTPADIAPGSARSKLASASPRPKVKTPPGPKPATARRITARQKPTA